MGFQNERYYSAGENWGLLYLCMEYLKISVTLK